MSLVRKILILTANPANTEPLRLSEEVREIRRAWERSQQRERFVIEVEIAVRTKELRRSLLDIKPDILHFSGHGGGEHGLALEDDAGQALLVKPNALETLFRVLRESFPIQCVVLNACYSEVQANAIQSYVDYVVGMKQAIGDRASRKFAVGFYDTLFAGESIESAFALGCNAIEMENIPEDHIPVLKTSITGQELALDSNGEKAASQQSPEPENIPKPLPSAPLEMPKGTMEVESGLYIERSADRIALEAIAYQGVTITIKGSRQMGKSSLLLRVMKVAEEAGKRVVFLDFQIFDRAAFNDADIFYKQFCTVLTDALELEAKREDFWRSGLGNSQNCTRYLERYVLKTIDIPLLLAMDEVESLFKADFCSDFFSMLRGWHNRRALKKQWKRLDLALVTSTEPSQLIANPNQSPFNVGVRLELEDFTPDQVAELNRRHGSPLDEKTERQLLEWVGGHPYLVRRALYLVAKERLTAEELFRKAADDDGPFSEHLHDYLLLWLDDRQPLVKCFIQILQGGNCSSERDFFQLQGAGLVRRESNKIVPRCRLYTEYFQERLRP